MKKGKIVLLSVLAVVLIAVAALCIFLLPWTQHWGTNAPGAWYAFHSPSGDLVLFGDGQLQDIYLPNTSFAQSSSEDYFVKMVPELEDVRTQVKRLILLEGYQNLNGMLLPGFDNVQEVWIPASVQSIGTASNDFTFDVFAYSSVKTIYFCGDAPEISPETFQGIQDPASLTIVYRPGAKGFTGKWEQFHLVEEDFTCIHSRYTWLNQIYGTIKRVVLGNLGFPAAQ